MEQDLNRIKLVLVEKKKTGKWLAQELGVSECTVSRWASNKAQPNLSSLNAIAKLLGVEMVTTQHPYKKLLVNKP